MDFLREFWEFLQERRKFWLIPIIIGVVLMLGIVIIGKGAGGLSPFIYALF